jgi:PAS domain S-box-containing protein
MKDEPENSERLLKEQQLRRRLGEIEAGRLEAVLKETSEKYQSLFEITSEAIFIADIDTLQILDFNDAALAMFGYRKEEMKNLSLFELVPGESRRRIEEEEEQQEAGKKYLFIEALGLRKDCSVFPIEIRSKHLRLNGKEYKVCFTRDVSDRKKAESALQQSEAYFRSLMENALDVIVVVDRDLRVRSVSPSLELILGAKPEAVLGKRPIDFIDRVYPEDREAVVSLVETSRRQVGVSGPIEIHAGVARGNPTVLELLANNLLDDPFIQGIVYTFRDITARKKAEEAVRESEETLHALVNGITDTAFLMDTSGTVIHINETGARRLGGTPNEIVGTDIRGWLPKELAEAREARIREILETGQPISMRDARNGMQMETDVIPVLDGNNQVRQIVIFARDVTEHIQLEEELLERARELESFGHTVSHDLRNPLTIIEGYAMTAMVAIEEGSHEVAEESLQSIMKAVRRVETFIENLFSFAQAGSPQGLAARVEPLQVIEELIEEYEPKIDRMGAVVEIVSELPSVWVDPLRFEQVMSNILDNALKFSSSSNSRPRIEISAEKDKDSVVFRITDNGIGIDSQFWEVVFEPFKRFSVSESSGLGIGLATVKRAVTGWGGEVWIESVPGSGSTCYFTAPMADG